MAESQSAGVYSKTMFTGRAPRREFWQWQLFMLFMSIVAYAFDLATFGFTLLTLSFTLGIATISLELLVGYFWVALFCVTLLPTLAIGARRLHDVGRSGWWLILYFLPIIGWAFLLNWFVRRGDEGENRFDSPLFLADARDFE